MWRPIVAGALMLALAACASEPRRAYRGHRGGPAGAEARLRRGLFVSPSGEPFRGADGLPQESRHSAPPPARRRNRTER